MNKNESAFPEITTDEAQVKNDHKQYYGNVYSYGGLTKREYFAGQILQGLCSNSDMDHTGESRVKLSIEIADELLKQLSP